jgi:signal transduction histidine kinase
LLQFLARANPFQRQLHASVAGEAGRVERVLATGRAFLAISSLIAIAIDPTEPNRYAPLAYSLMAGYVAYSLLILAWVRWRREFPLSFRLTLHAVDVLWPALISMFTTPASSPFFIFNAFVLLEAAYRWGFRETLATTAAEVLLYFSASAYTVLSFGSLHALLSGDFEMNRFIMRPLYLAIMGYLLGYLGEQEKLQRAEAALTARLIGKVQAEIGLRGALRAVMEAALGIFSSNRTLLILEEASSGRAYLWEGLREEGAGAPSLTLLELDSAQRGHYVFEPPGQAWYARRREVARHAPKFDLFALDAEGSALHNPEWTPPEALANSHPFESLLGAAVGLRGEWTGAWLFLDPDIGTRPQPAVRFLRALVQQLAPAIHGVFVARRLRSRAGAVERARVARELHDGVIQSLIGLEMNVDVLRRRKEAPPESLAADLGRIQMLLHHEVLNLRELMLQMKPLELGPKQLLDYLATTVEKFRQDTGLQASFVSSLEEVTLPPHVANELARIVQEALVNARKHSGARNIVVRFDGADGAWKLVIDDDGRGFDFSGHFSQSELDAARKGPLVIKERVRSIGGELTVESTPGRGSRLEILIPQKHYE